jgi:hypothetical protein
VHHGPDGAVEEILGLAVSPERGLNYPPALEVPLLGTGEGNRVSKIMALYVVTSYSILNKTLSPYNIAWCSLLFHWTLGERGSSCVYTAGSFRGRKVFSYENLGFTEVFVVYTRFPQVFVETTCTVGPQTVKFSHKVVFLDISHWTVISVYIIYREMCS